MVPVLVFTWAPTVEKIEFLCQKGYLLNIRYQKCAHIAWISPCYSFVIHKYRGGVIWQFLRSKYEHLELPKIEYTMNCHAWKRHVCHAIEVHSNSFKVPLYLHQNFFQLRVKKLR